MKKRGSDVVARARRILEIEAEAVGALARRIGPELERAVERLAATTGKVITTGVGKSGIIAHKVAATLASTGTPAFFVHAGEGVHGDLGMIVRGDSVIAISYSGETQEIVAMLPLLKRLRLPVVAITGKLDSTLGRFADVALDASVREEACSLALAPTSSTTAALALGDALALVLMERRGFREQDFAFLHPAGSLGRKLMRVSDLMRSGDDVPIVGERAKLREAITVITGKRLGHAGVVGGGGKLVGVLSDGDLRRILERGGDVLDDPVRSFLRRDPATIREHGLRKGVLTISPDALGAEALALMEMHSITALFTVDAKGRPTGIVHLHDLLKAGVV